MANNPKAYGSIFASPNRPPKPERGLRHHAVVGAPWPTILEKPQADAETAADTGGVDVALVEGTMKPRGESLNAEAALAQALRRWEGEGGALARAMACNVSGVFQREVGDAADAEAVDVIEPPQQLLPAEQASPRGRACSPRDRERSAKDVSRHLP
jgi:hypothetical protein